MRLSAANLEAIRTRPQRTILYLSIFQPTTIFQAQVNSGAIARGAREITYDNVTNGSYTSIEANFTMLVGTTPGAQDVGKIRVRSATSSVITVSENSNIAWADNLYLTVLKYVELWPIFPRIIQNPSNIEDVIFYKDWDIPYSNQNSILGTFPCAGDHQALFGGEQVYYSNTGTYNLLGDSLNHNWTFEGGSPSSSTSATPGLVTYSTPGHYVTRYSVSGSSGGVDTTYRYVSVYDRPGQGSNPPVTRWEVSRVGGSRDEGGYQATLRAYDNIPINENSVVILFAEDWYGSTKQFFGGNSPNNEKIFFVGHVLKDSIRHNYQHSFVEFSVGSVTEVMKQALGFSVSVESKASPSTWFELLDMDCRRAIYHYLRWHSTALSIADFQFLGDDYKIQYFDADRVSMYDAIDNLMRNTLMGKVVSDRQGKVWMEIDARAYSNPTGSFPSIMDITNRDWMGEPIIDREFSDKLSYFEAGGIAYSGVVTGTFSPLLAAAPGSTPSFRGKVEMPDGLAILGQAQLNQLVGNIFANANSRFPKIGMDMAGNYRHLDIAPQETVHATILASDTVANVPVNGLYIPDSLEWNYDAKNTILLPRIDFKNIVSGPAGETITIPDIPEDAGYAPGVGGIGLANGFNFNPITGLPPSLLAVGNRRYWFGTATITVPAPPTTSTFIIDYSFTDGDSTLATTPAGDYVHIVSAGTYLVNLSVVIINDNFTYARIRVNGVAHSAYQTGQSVWVNDTNSLMINTTATLLLENNDTIQTPFFYNKTSDSTGLNAFLTIVKLS